MLFTVLSAACLAGIAGLLLGGAIAFASKKFAVESDPRIENVQNALPGANCGGCGFAGCADFARALVSGSVSPDRCHSCTSEQLRTIAAILGQEACEAKRMTAVVRCGGSCSAALQRAAYNGILDCRSAAVVAEGGGKACLYGCIGYGSCARACPSGAIEIVNGLAVVHPEICTGCGKCVSVCPRHLILLTPADAPLHVFCMSADPPAARRKLCRSACISCRKCVRAAGEGMRVEGNRISVNYDDPPSADVLSAAACPTGALNTAAGHRAGVKDKPENAA